MNDELTEIYVVTDEGFVGPFRSFKFLPEGDEERVVVAYHTGLVQDGDDFVPEFSIQIGPLREVRREYELHYG